MVSHRAVGDADPITEHRGTRPQIDENETDMDDDTSTAKPRTRLERVLRGVELAEAATGVAVLAGIVVLVMVQVIVRFTSLSGWAWTGELARFGLVWLTFILAGLLLGRGEHISLDVIDHVLPERGRRIVFVASSIIVGLICLGFVREGIGLMEAQATIKSSAARIPMPLVYAVPTLGFALTALRAFTVPFLRKETS